MKKFRYTLQGLDCENCARKIEEAIKKSGKVENAVVNFNTLTLSFTAENDEEEFVKSIVSKIEPDVIVTKLGENNSKEKPRTDVINIIRFSLGLVMAVLSMVIKNSVISEVFIVLSYLLLMYRVFLVAIKQIFKNKVLDENTLICISAVGAYAVGKHMEGIMVLALYEFGKILEAKAINNTRRSIKALMDIKPEYANLKVGDRFTQVSPEQVKVGDIVVIKPGERVPVDGVIINGETNVNNAALTGESKYVPLNVGDQILAGGINIDGAVEVRVDREYSATTVARILELTENATDRKAKTENTVASLAKLYVPVVMILAVLVALVLPLITDITYSQSIYRGLIFLVISCPCAIAISVPLSYFCGIGRASSAGVLVKGSDYLDSLKDLKTIVMDKTGTITTGNFSVSKIVVMNDGYTEEELLNLCKLGESFSNHPIAKAILNGDKVDSYKVKNYTEISGKGISFEYEGKKILVGNNNLVGIKQEDIDLTRVYISVDENVAGYVELEDILKEEAHYAIDELKKRGISVKMFTGDNESVARRVASEVGIDDVYYNMLPQDKYSELEQILGTKNNPNAKVAFVGDGINDSPVLALADVGISMGGVGSNSAIEASDVVIMTDNLKKILEAMSISKYTSKIIKQNLIFALGTKILFLVLSTIGLTGMAFAIFADVGVTVLTILNSIRILKKKI